MEQLLNVSEDNSVANKAISIAENSQIAYCKSITANDVGLTGGHQSGYYIHKESFEILFDRPGERGVNKDRQVKIKWQDDFETTSRFIYYGARTRNEYRITQFGRDFPYLSDDCLGAILVLCKMDEESYEAFVLNTELEINTFLDYFEISPVNPNGLISVSDHRLPAIDQLFLDVISTIKVEFPTGEFMASSTRDLFSKVHPGSGLRQLSDPDNEILGWVEMEYNLFRALEQDRYKSYLAKPFENTQQLIETANTILNRRKSRAGKSLEKHLAAIFDTNELSYSEQQVTELNNKPDFIIPGIEFYRNGSYPSDKLVFLAAKTTCKDRWRQVINEADRIPDKHLFTLQQGISPNQLKEMAKERVTLVIPKSNFSLFPPEYQSSLLSLKEFISYAKEITA